MDNPRLDTTALKRFIASLSDSLHSLCNGCMVFDSGIEIVGYINVNIDKGSKLNYVLDEKVERSIDDSITYESNSFLAEKNQSDNVNVPVPDIPVSKTPGLFSNKRIAPKRKAFQIMKKQSKRKIHVPKIPKIHVLPKTASSTGPQVVVTRGKSSLYAVVKTEDNEMQMVEPGEELNNEEDDPTFDIEVELRNAGDHDYVEHFDVKTDESGVHFEQLEGDAGAGTSTEQRSNNNQTSFSANKKENRNDEEIHQATESELQEQYQEQLQTYYVQNTFTQNGRRGLIINDHRFKASKPKLNAKFLTWRCNMSNCSSYCRTTQDLVLTQIKENHTHEAYDHGRNVKFGIHQKIRKRLESCPTDKASKIIGDILGDNIKLLSKQERINLKQCIHRRRKQILQIKNYPNIVSNDFQTELNPNELSTGIHCSNTVTDPLNNAACSSEAQSFPDNIDDYNDQGKSSMVHLYRCSFCYYSFLNASDLQFHVRMHTSDNNGSFVCELCGKTLVNQQSLRYHRYIHTGVKPNVCEHCGVSFRLIQQLRKHKMKEHEHS